MKRVSFIFLLIYLIFIVILLNACGEMTEFDSTSLNVRNELGVIKIGGKIFLSKNTKDGVNCITKMNSNKVIVETENYGSSFNCYKENLIYMDGNKLYLYNFVSKENKLITETVMGRHLMVVDNYIYYLEKNKLIKISIDSGEKLTILDDACLSFDIYKNYVYYQAIHQGKTVIKKMNLSEPSEGDILYYGAATHISACEEGIYFLNGDSIGLQSSDNKIYRIDNNIVNVVSEKPVYTYNISGDWIYYSNLEDEGKLYKMKKDGTDDTKILDVDVVGILIYDNTIICQTRNNMYSDFYYADLNKKNIKFIKFSK